MSLIYKHFINPKLFKCYNIDLITNNTISIVIIAFFMYKDMTLNKTLEKALNKLQSAINILNVRLEERKEVNENGD